MYVYHKTIDSYSVIPIGVTYLYLIQSLPLNGRHNTYFMNFLVIDGIVMPHFLW